MTKTMKTYRETANDNLGNLPLPNLTTAEQAREYAIDWQHWASEQNLSYAELAEWAEALRGLALDFDLVEEFEENGII